MRGERMPQGVRTDAEARAAAAAVLRNEALHAAARQPAAPRVDKQRVSPRQGRAALQPLAQRLFRLDVEGHNPFLPALPHHPDHAVRQVEVLEIEGYEFAEA